MASGRLRIEFMDGTGEVVDWVEKTPVKDGVLYAYGPSSDYVAGESKGAWPLVNIRKWKIEER